jgi:pepF/M3 family oligoendopeptidase
MPETSTTRFSLTWDLDSLLPHPDKPEFQQALDRYRERLAKLADESDRLPVVQTASDIVAKWVAFLREFEGIEALAVDLGAFIGCHAAGDAGNKKFRQLEAALSALDPLRERIATNLDFAVRDVTERDFESFLGADDWLKSNAFFLRQRRKKALLRLPKAEELLAAELSVDGIHAWGRMFDRLSGDLRVKVMERGEVVEKSPGQIRFDSPEREVRENNSFAADKAWRTIADSNADSLNHISGTRLTIYRRLGLEDHLVAPLHKNRMTRETLNAMWSAVTDRKPVLLKYLARKAELLGLAKPAWYDIAAPLPADIAGSSQSSSITYDDACERIITTFDSFSPPFGDFARHALSNRWIEAEDRTGKRQGGFCTGFPTKRESRIFMTFTNSVDDMSTLAHELGHAYHSWVLRDEPLFLQDYPMNLAETASTFAEAVLGEQRLRDCKSRGEQIVLLDKMLEDSVAFLMNIHARFIFEDNFHRERAQGELSTERFSELMKAAQQAAYLNALADDGWNPLFWASKLHFYISGLPFYNFPYTFGYLLSLGLYALAGEAGAAFPDQYRRLLIATGCQEAEDAVRSTFGHDLTSPTFWNKSLDVVERRVERFLTLSAD